MFFPDAKKPPKIMDHTIILKSDPIPTSECYFESLFVFSEQKAAR